MSVSAVKSRLNQVKSFIESRRTGEIEHTLKAAEGFLATLTDDERAPLVAEIAALRAQVAEMLSPDDERKIKAAKGKLQQARSYVESDASYDVMPLLKIAEDFLAGTAEKHSAEVRGEIAELRKQREKPAAPPAAAPRTRASTEVSSPPPAASIEPPSPPRTRASTEVSSPPPPTEPPRPSQPATPPTTIEAPRLSDDDASKLSRAKSRITGARTLVASGRLDDVEPTLAAALGFLDGLPETVRAPLVADADAVRLELAAAMRAERVRVVTTRLDRFVHTATSNLEGQPQASATDLERARDVLASDEATSTLSKAELDEWRMRIDDVARRLQQLVRADALDRAAPAMRELEERVAGDPFEGLDPRDAHVAWSRLGELKNRVLAWLRELPPDDPDAVAYRARLFATDAAIDKASAAWGKAELDAAVESGWAAIEAAIAGWDAETHAPSLLADPELPKTRLAIQRLRYWLDSPEAAQIETRQREAEATLGAAATKLAAAYDQVLDAAEKMATPMRRLDLDRPLLLAVAAESALAGTHHADEVATRARALDARWKADVAAIMQERQQLYDRLTDEASSRWPAIVSSIGAREGFDPMDEAWIGKPVLLAAIYNRAGWDFSPKEHQLALRIAGVPVAGRYEPHVLAALEHAWYELKLDVSDRIEWDVIGIVEGEGMIGERTTVILRDRDTQLEVGKLEEYRPISCVQLRIIALHAGPVAVGP